MTDNGIHDELSTRQRRAIAALLAERNVREAAKASNTPERTLWTWLSDPTFRAALLQAEGDAIDAATRRLTTLADSAIDTLAGILQDAMATAGVRVRAAQAVLDYLLRLRELRNVEERLTALERAYAEKS